jgi:S-(hydroxymethyl)glutathione dehydrogenase/alcohol dehydrogenase
VEAVRHGGTLGLAGFYGGKANGFPIGDIFAKCLYRNAGPALIHKYLDELSGYIADGLLSADDSITHRMPLTDALRAYDLFARKEENCVKVILYPSGTLSNPTKQKE